MRKGIIKMLLFTRQILQMVTSKLTFFFREPAGGLRAVVLSKQEKNIHTHDYNSGAGRGHAHPAAATLGYGLHSYMKLLYLS